MDSRPTVPLPAAAVELLNSDRLAHVGSINPDATPHLTVAWTESDGRTIHFGAQAQRRKISTLARDPASCSRSTAPRPTPSACATTC
jgi:hypothetical protein